MWVLFLSASKKYIREKIKNYVRINGFRFTERKIGIDSTRLNRVVNKADYNPKLRTLKLWEEKLGIKEKTAKQVLLFPENLKKRKYIC